MNEHNIYIESHRGVYRGYCESCDWWTAWFKSSAAASHLLLTHSGQRGYYDKPEIEIYSRETLRDGVRKPKPLSAEQMYEKLRREDP